MLYVKRTKQELPTGRSVELNNYIIKDHLEDFVAAKFVYLLTGKFVYINAVSNIVEREFKVSITRWEF